MEQKQKKPTLEEILKKYEKGYSFNQQIGLYDTVKVNEDFFIGNQWEGVQSNGLPTPVFNFLKQVVLFQVATITSDNMAMQAAPLSSVTPLTKNELEKLIVDVSKDPRLNTKEILKDIAKKDRS